ncbi:30S ribosomal protein S16 [Candidatus Gracilibacteria bacterium GN02-872]|nr:30S ribosomal protein S16 [Candidatus Gracilibacteria bacterium GN02-872]RKW24521.1 MAG: 30S ribosomal protein S16 [Candidatus Gracilibacteria bacterium]
MLKIRLSRAGKKNMPFFRVVLTEHTAAAKHGYKEVLGFYNPLTKELKLKDLEKIKKYLSQGIQFSPRVEKLIKTNNISL